MVAAALEQRGLIIRQSQSAPAERKYTDRRKLDSGSVGLGAIPKEPINPASYCRTYRARGRGLLRRAR